MSRTFGWDLPPWVTARMINPNAPDDGYKEGPCEVCCRPVDACVCQECTVCGETGRLTCYSVGHASGSGLQKMPLRRDQVLARERYRLQVAKQHVIDCEQALLSLEGSEEWDPAEFPPTSLF